MVDGYGVLVHLDRCIGCRACQVACKEWNGRPADTLAFAEAWPTPSEGLTSPLSLTANTWKLVVFKETRIVYPSGFEDPFIQPVPYQCMHCLNPPCARACPVGAIQVTEEGAVVINEDSCIGCGFCEASCPFNIPKKSMDTGKYYKCTFCVDRLQAGLQPACVETCPTGVFEFGRYEEIKSKAESLKAAGMEVYGLDLPSYVGGSTRWIYAISREKAQVLKEMFPAEPVQEAGQLRETLQKITRYGGTAMVLALAALGLLSLRVSRMAGKKEESQQAGV